MSRTNIGTLSAMLVANHSGWSRGFSQAQKSLDQFATSANKTTVASQASQAMNTQQAAAKAQAQMAARATQMYEQTRTPLERYQDGIKEANKLLKAKAITTDTHARQVKQLGQEYHAATSIMAGFGQRLHYLAMMAAAGQAIYAGVSAVIGGFRMAAQLESYGVSLEVFSGSADKANSMMEQLKRYAIATPFRLPEVMEAATMLHAYEAQGDDAIDTMRRLGDIASGLNKPFSDIIWLFGTTKAEGRLMTRDMRQWATRGFPILKELQSMFGLKTQAEVFKLAEQGVFTFEHVWQIIKKVTDEGGKFHNLTLRMSGTLGGLWAKLADALSITFGTVAGEFVKMFGIKDLLNDAVTATDTWAEKARMAMQPFANAANLLKEVIGYLPDFAADFEKLSSIDASEWTSFASSVIAGAAALGGFILAFKTLTIALTVAGMAMRSVKSAMLGIISNPITAALATATVGFSILRQKMAEARAEMEAIFAKSSTLGEMSEDELLGSKVQFVNLTGDKLISTTIGQILEDAKADFKGTEAQVLSALRFADQLAEQHKKMAGDWAAKAADQVGWLPGNMKMAFGTRAHAENVKAIEFSRRAGLLRQAYERMKAAQATAAPEGTPAEAAKLLATSIGETEAELKKSIATFGMSEDQIKVWELSTKGATAAHLAMASGLIKTKAALAESTKLTTSGSFMATMDDYALKARAIHAAFKELALKGGTPFDMAGWGKAIGALDKSMDEYLTSAAADVFGKTRTPMEKMEDELLKLDMLWEKGKIDVETYERAVKMAGKEMEEIDAKSKDMEPPPFMEMGSREALQAIARFERESMRRAKKEENPEVKARLQRAEMIKALDKMVGLIPGIGPIKLGKI